MRQDAALAPARWLGTPPDVADEPLVVITEALLPIFLWRDVAVLRAVEQKLSAVERFLIEAALLLGDVTADDAEELTGLPEDATRRIAGHLSELGVLSTDGIRYWAQEEAARAALTRQVLTEYRRDSLTFVVLPRSGDALAFEHRSGKAPHPHIHRLDPLASAPVTGLDPTATRTAALRALIKDGKVVSLPGDLVDLPEPETGEPVGDTCPVYRYEARLHYRRGQVRATGHAYGERGGDRVQLDIREPARVIDYWLDQAELLHLAEAFQAACQAVGLSPENAKPRRDGPSRWALEVNSLGALELVREGKRLCQPGGLEMLSTDRATKVEFLAVFEPADPGAAAMFAVDSAADQLEAKPPGPLGDSDITKAIADGCATYSVDPRAVTAHEVRQRLWERGREHLVYRLRASEDFAYD
jgi:hypothetical protein